MAQTGERLKFLGWQRPGLGSAIEHVLSLSIETGEIDLSRVVIVVPGARVGRILRAMLVEHAATRRCPLSPPQLITPGSIVDAILELTGPFAGAAARRLAWSEALRSIPEARLVPLIPRAPERDDLPSWLAMGDMLGSCHLELAAGMVLFSEVPERCGMGAAFVEEQRWTAAAVVQLEYRRLLEEHGLRDSDLDRIDALRQARAGVTPVADVQVVVLGVSELSAVARAALLLAGNRVTYLVFADEQMRKRFDECGCPREDAWASSPLDLREEQIVFAESPSDQADCALEAIAGLGGGLAADQIAIGTADEELVPYLERRSQIVGAEVRYAGGMAVRRSSPWQLLAVIADYLERQDFASLRALVCHPDVERRLLQIAADGGDQMGTEHWLGIMDDYGVQSLHGRLTGAWYSEKPDVVGLLSRVYEAVEQMLSPLRTSAGAVSVQAWAEPILGVLEQVYAGITVGGEDGPDDEGRRLLGVCLVVRDAVQELKDLPAGRAEGWPAMSAAEAVRFVMQQSGESSVPEDPRPGAIEILGWLELPLDPSEAVVVVGMNQGKIPASFRGDAFLSDRVRQKLGIASSHQRFARDAYVLTSLVRSRHAVTLIGGRRSSEGDASWPSRLLTACSEQDMAPRVLRFLGKTPELRGRLRLSARVRPGVTSGFPVAPIADKPAVNSMRITAFRTYISSPYLFYLQQVLRLEESGEPDGELDPMSFGNLIHSAIEGFGRSDAKHSTSRDVIQQCLMDELSSLARKQFGDRPHVAVGLQLEIAKRRLEGFAGWQASRTRDGWLTDQLPEWVPAPGKGVLMVDGTPMGLRGRIDRIEKHAQTGQLAVLDFKTGDKAKTPEQAHRGRDGWRDLQLPLYRHLAAELGAGDDTTLGYVVIPSGIEGVKLLTAEWTAGDLAEADAKAAEVVRSVRAGAFEDVGDGAEEGSVFAALCGMHLLGNEDGNESGASE